MNRRLWVIFLFAAVAASFSALHARAGAAQPFDARSAFDALRGLEGTWEGTSDEGDAKEIRVVYHVTAAGNAVVETLFPGTPHEMVTMYHPDGDKLRLTHYCAAGNQPRMVFRKGGAPGEMQFAFDGAGNLKTARDGHMHDLVLHVLASDHVVADWTYFADGAKKSVTHFDLHRAK